MNNLLNLKSFFKFLGRNKAYTLIDVFGLSISLMFVLLIAVYTVQEMSTDRQHMKADRIYLVGNENWLTTGAAIPYKIKERYPEVEKVCPVVANNFMGMKVISGDRKMKADLMFADSTFFDLFDFKLEQGNRDQALAAMNYAVLSSSFARKMFGTDDAMGRQILVGDTISVMVNGVVEDMLHSSIPAADLIIRWEQVGCLNWSLGPDRLNNAGSTSCFILAHEGSDFPARAEEMTTWFKEFYWPYQIEVAKQASIVSLQDHYFIKGTTYKTLLNGDWDFVVVLMSVGILILVFAVINYINLTVAQAGFRAKEMATRRLLGSSRGELFMRLMLESTFLTFISLGLGILLAVAAVPFVNDLLQTKIDLGVLATPVWLLALGAMLVTVGVVSGLLPATIISASKPIDVVRGAFRTQTKMVFSKVFIVFQNVITITMIAVSIVMVSQIIHMIKAPVGYNVTNLLSTRSVEQSQVSAFMSELRGLSCVKRIGQTQGLPFFSSNNWTSTYEGKSIAFQQFVMDKECYDMLGLEILRDNHLTGDGWFISEEALRQMNLPEDATSFTLGGDSPIVIAGIMRDLHCFGNVTTEMRPVMFRFLKEGEQGYMFVIETQGDPFVANEQIGKIYEEVTGLEYEGYFMDELLQKSFDSQIRLAKIVGVFATIAILISLLGLLAMSTYFIQQRSTEVSVRKVFGSGNGQILRKLVFTFLNYVLIAFVIAVPVIIYFMQKWLSDYSYRIELSPLIFVVAGLFCLLISFVAVFFQSWRAATSNPVDAFRNKQ